MAHLIQSGDGRPRRGFARLRGFTLIELMIVMAIIVTLIAIAVPQYQKSIMRSKESVLKSNLFTMRQMIDEYSFDKQKAPQTLQDLVSDGYLREIPIDPIAGNNTTWKIVMEDPQQSVSQNEPGIWDVKSGSDKTSLDGTAYADW
jgi:general secretion pathway protein G